MKKIIFLLAFALIGSVALAQKSKKPAAKSPGKSTLATTDGITAELLKKKDQYRFYLLVASKDAKGKKDSLMLKEYADPLVPISQGERLKAALDAAGVTNQRYVYVAGHGNFTFADSQDINTKMNLFLATYF